MQLRMPLVMGLFVLGAGALDAQEQPSPRTLSLAEARAFARRLSPEIAAALAAVQAALGRERQAGAVPNPTISYNREQTSRAGNTNAQDIVLFEQRLEIGGQKGARTAAAKLHREEAEHNLSLAEGVVNYQVTRAYALALAADRRATVTNEAAEVFARAVQISRERLAAGDVSGYANRRIALEGARYASLRAQAGVERRAAMVHLAGLVAPIADSVVFTPFALSDSLEPDSLQWSLDSLRYRALQHRPELRTLELDVQAWLAEAKVASREVIPSPLAAVGFKREQFGGTSFKGFVLQVGVPVPLWDRRAGAAEAARAESSRRHADLERARRQVIQEVDDAYSSSASLRTDLQSLGAQLGDNARVALRAAATAYAEGEISLIEWLDAVRAYQEAESSYATLRAELVTQRAALERAAGVVLFKET